MHTNYKIAYENKSDKLSAQYRNEGNQIYIAGNYVESIFLYNKAICYAASKGFLALAYANRSAVFLELRKYQICLENIKLARENNYPSEKIQKLNEREEKCKKGIEEESKLDPSSFMKLSYPANPKIPFVVGCLELRTTKQFGRGVYTKQDLNCGDILAFEKPVFRAICFDSKYRRCCNCLTIQMLNLIPCLKTASIMFCSIECRDKLYEKFTNLQILLPIEGCVEGQFNRNLQEAAYPFGGLTKLMEHMKKIDYKNSKKTIFDYDFSDPNDPSYEMNRVTCALSLNTHGFDFRQHKTVFSHSPMFSRMKPFHQEFFAYLSEIIIQNITFFSSLGTQAPVVHIFNKLFNHSCCPNVSFSELNGEVVCVVIRPTKAGDQLFFNQLPGQKFNRPRAERQEILFADHHFVCRCLFCINDLYMDKLPIIDRGGLEESRELYEMIIHKNFKSSIDGMTSVQLARQILSYLAENHENIEKYGYDETSHGYNLLCLHNVSFFARCCDVLQLPSVEMYEK